MNKEHVMEIRYMKDDCLYVAESHSLYGENEIEFVCDVARFCDGENEIEIPVRDLVGIILK